MISVFLGIVFAVLSSAFAIYIGVSLGFCLGDFLIYVVA